MAIRGARKETMHRTFLRFAGDSQARNNEDLLLVSRACDRDFHCGASPTRAPPHALRKRPVATRMMMVIAV